MTSQPVAKVPDLPSRLNAPQSDPVLYHLSQGISGLLDALLDRRLDLMMLAETDLPFLPPHAGIIRPVNQQHCEI